MNTKTTLSTLIAAATLTMGGFAVAQANPPTSTPGNGCTATANAMKGGNMGSSPSAIECATPAGAPTAAAATGSTTAAPATSARTTAADSSAMGSSGAARAAPMRVAKADRN